MLIRDPKVEGYILEKTDENYIFIDQDNPQDVVMISRRTYHWLYGLWKFLAWQEKEFLHSPERLKEFEQIYKEREKAAQKEKDMYWKNWHIFWKETHFPKN